MSAISSARSGMEAASLGLDVAANDIANASTPGFQPSAVALATAAGGGVAAQVVAGQAPPTLPGVPAAQQPSGTDLVLELATLAQTPIVYAANAKVVQAVDRTTASLLDAFA